MAKKKKQRKVDFTKEEIMDMSQRGSVQDLDYSRIMVWILQDLRLIRREVEQRVFSQQNVENCYPYFAGILISILPEEQKVRQRM